MLFSVLIIAVCVHLAHMCPTSLESCDCVEVIGFDDDPLLIVRCNALSYTSLGQVAETEKLVQLTFEGFQMKHLPSQLLAGLRLRNVRLERCEITSIDDHAFPDPLQTLVSISLAYNELERVPTSSFQNLTTLRYLNLDHNRLEVLQVDSFKGISSIGTLSLKGNKLRFIDDAAFQIGSNINDLYLTTNELTAFPSRPLSRINFIKGLHLGYNKISSLLPEEIAAINGKNLTIIYLNNNRIRYFLPRTFQLRGLRSLHLGTNEIASIHPLTFQGIENTLSSLKLENNLLEEVPVASFKNLSSLSYLDLSNNRICTVRKDDFLPYGKTLSYLYLQNNSLTTVEPRSFDTLDSIECLDLSANRRTTLPHESFAPVLDSLRTLLVNDNPLHCDREVTWLKNWMFNSTVIGKSSKVRCASPAEYKGMILKEVPKDLITGPQSIFKEIEAPDSMQIVTDPVSTYLVTEQPADSQEAKSIFTKPKNIIYDTVLEIKRNQEESSQLHKNIIIEMQNKIYDLLLEMKKDQEGKQLEKNPLIET